MALTEHQQQTLRQLLEQGLPLHPRPWQVLAETVGAEATELLAQARQWQHQGLFRRFGLVVRHRALGYRANAMLVLDVPDHQVTLAGESLARSPGVNLCYQRPRRPNWHYNLFCMIHGQERTRVVALVQALLRQHRLDDCDHRLLFSLKAFKQCGGRFVAPEANR